MQNAKPAGPGAGVVKYDILTALLSMAVQEQGTTGRLALRLSLLVTSRFNWRTETFQTGQREIARLWGVTERTAKRDLAQMRNLGWISVQRSAARGRVATHAIHLDRVLTDSMPRWQSVGPDYEARMTGRTETASPEVAKVVPLHPQPHVERPDDSLWGQASDILRGQDPALHHAWFARLTLAGREGSTLYLNAPTPFIARYVETHFRTMILAAVARGTPGIRDLSLTG